MLYKVWLSIIYYRYTYTQGFSFVIIEVAKMFWMCM